MIFFLLLVISVNLVEPQGYSNGEREYQCRKGSILTIEEGSGVIISPSYPNKYPNLFECMWRLSSNAKVELRFVSFDLEEKNLFRNCPDFVKIYDGPQKNNNDLIGEFCGHDLPGPFTSSGNTLLVRFKSDFWTKKPGFKAYWRTLNPSTSSGPGISTIAPTSNPRPTDQCPDVEIVEDNHGFVRSPGFPSFYPPNMECDWTITVAEGQKIAVRFLTLAIESGTECEFDMLNVYDGKTAEDRFVGKLCGFNPPKAFSSTSNSLHFKFISDNADNYQGFRLEYLGYAPETTTKKPITETLTPSTIAPTTPILGCNGQADIITEYEGKIISPNYPETYPSNADCGWRIVAPSSKKILITFEQFAVEKQQYCLYDRLAIYDGSTKSNELLAVLCGNGDPKPISSTSNTVYLNFISDENTNLQGFSLRFETVDNEPSPTNPPEVTKPTITVTRPTNPPITEKPLTKPPIPEGEFTDIEAEDCDFENDFCNWIQDNTDNAQWKRWRGTTGTSDTGPSNDANGKNGYYTYLEASQPQVEGSKARLYTRAITIPANQPICMKFDYHMYGQDMGRLRIYFIDDDESKLIWHRDGDQNNSWRKERINIKSETGKQFILVIEGVVGSSAWSDIAIDDIEFLDSPCLAIPLRCGAQNPIVSRIIGGQASKSGQWPWQVLIRTTVPGTSKYQQCGGSLISPQWVLTAAHCVENGEEGGMITEPEYMRILFGERSLLEIEEAEFSITPIKIIPMPLRKTTGVGPYDVLLVKLPYPLTLTQDVNVICLPDKDDTFPPGTNCSVAGWGLTGYESDTSEELLHVNVQIISATRCLTYFGRDLKSDNVCAGNLFEKLNSCQGDSGGPLVCKVGKQYVQAGVVSFGAPCGYYTKSTPGVYASVPFYIDWIEETVAAN